MRMAPRTTPFPFLPMTPHLDGDLGARKVRAPFLEVSAQLP